MINQTTIHYIENLLEKTTGIDHLVENVEPVIGGCINSCFKIMTNSGVYFVKANSSVRYPGMFEAEAKGLALLASAGQVEVPKVVAFGKTGTLALLILNFVEGSYRAKDFWSNFGVNLARLHNTTKSSWGLDHDNYIGSLPQHNKATENWVEFFVSQRLSVQLKIARQNNLLPDKTQKLFERLFNKLGVYFSEEPPSLLHGDLWGGNFMTGPSGQAVIIDPAVYFGHRYMDLGMTRLFGGFSELFYHSYQEENPLDSNWQAGVEVANLYPLMVHVNLFGGSYLSSVNQTLQRYC